MTGKTGKGCQGICIKDTWTKPKGGRIQGGRWEWVGWGRVVEGKWRQLCLNNNKIFKNFFLFFFLVFLFFFFLGKCN